MVYKHFPKNPKPGVVVRQEITRGGTPMVVQYQATGKAGFGAWRIVSTKKKFAKS